MGQTQSLSNYESDLERKEIETKFLLIENLTLHSVLL